ncbi:hypothetical protein [Pontibacter rugosus]|uniref:Uncharacterized protein n=1 Tax=Pontibacter rugosus TaxID=1745966 RepID=A0ABW3SK05_9BACT
MADKCANMAGVSNLDPSCDALRKRGGADKTFYILAISQLLAAAPIGLDDITKELTSIALKPGEVLKSFKGRKLKNSTKTGMEQTDNGPSYTHGGSFVAYFDSQAEKESIEQLALNDDLVIIVPLNSGHFEAHGLVGTKGLSDGLLMTIAEGGSGVQYEDATTLTLNFDGKADKLPIYCKFGADRAASIAFLEDLLTAV